MNALLIKLKLEPACDKELIKYFESIPARRRAEQVRRLLTTALNPVAPIPDGKMHSSSLQNGSVETQLDDEELFAKDMADF